MADNIETMAANPTLIQDQVANMLLNPLRAASVVLSNNPRIFDSAEPLRIPKLVSSTDPSWVGEGQLIPDADVAFGELKLMPTDRASIKVLVKMTNELVRASAMNIESVLQTRVVDDVNYKLDTALLVGDGANKSVTGIFNQPGTTAVNADPTTPDGFLAGLAAMAALEETPTVAFVNGSDFYKLAGQKDTSGKYLLQPDATKAATQALFGVRMAVSNKVPVGKMALVNMNEVAVVRDIAPTVTPLKERYAEFDVSALRIVTRYDLGLLRPEAVTIVSKAA